MAFPIAAYPYTTTATAITHRRALSEPSAGAAISNTPMPIQSMALACPDHPQQPLRAVRLDMRLGENTQLSNRSVSDCDKNG
jgi:hypothetical protein